MTRLIHSIGLAVITLFLLLAGEVEVPPGAAQSVMSPAGPGSSPLPNGCTGSLPPGQPEPSCCISGLVYMDGKVVAGAEVEIEGPDGQRIQLVTNSQSQDSRPHYHVSLSSAPLNVQPGDSIAITGRYSGLERTEVYVVQPGGQQVDIVLTRPQTDDLVYEGQIWGQADAGEFNFPRGMATDSMGKVYVVDSANARVQVFDYEGNVLRQWGMFGSLPGQFLGPSGIAIDSSDNVYITDIGAHRILKFASDGSFINQWGSQGNDNAQFRYPDGVAVAAEFVYVADRENHRIQKFTTGGKYVGQWGSFGSNNGQFSGPRGVAVADGFVYVTDSGNHRVQKFGTDGSYHDQWGSQGSDNGQFNSPWGIAVAEGFVYVADQLNHRIQKFDTDGNHNTQWGSQGNGNGQFRSTSGVAVADGFVYVAADNSHRIQKFTMDGSYVHQWGSFGRGPGQLFGPRDIAAADGFLYVADHFNHRIQKLEMDGSYVDQWGSLGSLNGQLRNPSGVALADNFVYVADTGNHRIQKFTTDGTYVGQWGSFGNAPGQFDSPWDVAVAEGVVYVTDTGNHRVQKFDSNGGFVDQWGNEGSGNGQLSSPRGIDVAEGVVYVTDSGNHRVQKFEADGSYLDQWGSFGSGNGQFNNPLGIIVVEGSVYVTDESNHRLQKFGTDGSYDGQWGSLGSSHTQFRLPADIAVGAGVVYVSDRNNNRIQMLRPRIYSKPIATIRYRSSNANSLPPSGTLELHGWGADSDESDTIVSYLWKSGPNVLGSVASLSLEAADLTPGEHKITLEVQDDEGEWSEPVETYIYVNTPPQVTWTFLLYLVGDNQYDGAMLMGEYQRVIDRLRAGGVSPNARIAIQVDGNGSVSGGEDTRRHLIGPGSDGKAIPLGEQMMDDPATLADFIRWGQTAFPAEHYYLAIADHGQAIQGTAWDHTTDLQDGSIQDDTYLTTAEIKEALTAENVAPIDVLHLDGCSMNLVDVSFELRESAEYLIASQYLAWSYFAYDDYQQHIGATTTPEQLAETIVERYAVHARAEGRPFTLTALDLDRAGPVANGVDSLAVQLGAWAANDAGDGSRPALLEQIRSQSQKFEYDGNYVINDLDPYVDLLDLAARIHAANLTSAIRDEATTLIAELEGEGGFSPMILAHERGSNALPSEYAGGAWVDLENAHGLSVFYPPSQLVPGTGSQAVAGVAEASFSIVYDDYINDRLFDFTVASRWDQFLRAAVGVPEPDEPLDPPPGPLPILDRTNHLFLPLIAR